MYVIKVKGKRRTATPEPQRDIYRLKSDETEPPIGPVQGITPDSVEEWRTALALDTLKLRYDFQKAVGGGRGGKQYKGGQVIDFMVYTFPMPTPVSVEGAYFHGKNRKLEEAYQWSKLKQHYKGQIKPIVRVDTRKLPTLRAAIAFYKKEFLRQ
ncbi:MAG: hypothetical protein WC455_21825 [Dehalococcoidia bacterium]|jgi:hypothetical protein